MAKEIQDFFTCTQSQVITDWGHEEHAPTALSYHLLFCHWGRCFATL